MYLKLITGNATANAQLNADMQNKIIEDGHTTIAKKNSRLAEIRLQQAREKALISIV
jgi:hypothetical protein